MKSNGVEGTCSSDLLFLVLHSSVGIAENVEVKENFGQFSEVESWITHVLPHGDKMLC